MTACKAIPGKARFHSLHGNPLYDHLKRHVQVIDEHSASEVVEFQFLKKLQDQISFVDP